MSNALRISAAARGMASIAGLSFPFSILAFIRYTGNPTTNYPAGVYNGSTGTPRSEFFFNGTVRGLIHDGTLSDTANSTVDIPDVWLPVVFEHEAANDRTITVWDSLGGSPTAASRSTTRDIFDPGPITNIAIGSRSGAGTFDWSDFAIVEGSIDIAGGDLDSWAAGRRAPGASLPGTIVFYQPLTSVGWNDSGSVGSSMSSSSAPTLLTDGPAFLSAADQLARSAARDAARDAARHAA